MFAASKTAAASGAYQVSRSLRFSKFANAPYLGRTPATASNRRTFTISMWVKSAVNLDYYSNVLFTSRPAGNVYSIFDLQGSQGTQYALAYSDSNGASVVTQSLYRDPAAWYHIVFSVDTTQATASNRVRIYVNGVQITAFATATYPSQNADTQVNNTNENTIGGFVPAISTINSWDGYMTEVYLIDGQALTASSFGATDPITGVWAPTAFSGGAYGTNGFYLNFSDNSNTTATTLGKDYSGNGNNWTPNNFSVTAGINNDSMVDVPTPYGLIDTGAGGTIRGNYPTLNPLKVHSYGSLGKGNLRLKSQYSNAGSCAVATITPSSGYYYWEMTCSGSNAGRPWGLGFATSTASPDSGPGVSGSFSVSNGSGSTVAYYIGASLTATLSTSSTWVDGDIISVAWDSTSTINKVWVGRNGVWYPSTNGGTVASNADVAAGNYPTFTLSNAANTDPVLVPMFGTYDTNPSIDVNFGQRAFSYTAPSGYKCLCTQNLPTPAIGATAATQAGKFFNTVTYTPTSYPAVTTGVGFQPDFTWWKNRVRAEGHILFDVLRGSNLFLRSNTTAADDTQTNGWVANSDGWTSSSGSYTLNEAYVAWNWKANGAGVTNTAGTITSTVSANTTSGFSVLTYTGTGAVATIGHGLGVAPSMVIVKSRSTPASTYAARWSVYHVSLGNTKVIRLESTDAAGTASYWNNTTPTSTVFSVDGDIYGANVSGVTYVSYCFAPIAGYSAFGSYTGNGSSNGPFVITGFRPAFLLIRSTGVESWFLFDTTRGPYNDNMPFLQANTNGTEYAFDSPAILSNGFKLITNNGSINGNGNTMIYAAFASVPFKYTLAR